MAPEQGSESESSLRGYAPSSGEHREILPARQTSEVLGKYTPEYLSIRVTMGQNPSKHRDYIQVLKTLLKSSGVEISQSPFKELFSAIQKYCYWLDPDKGTLRHKEWHEVMRCLRRAYQRREGIPLSVWSVGNLTSTALGRLQSETSDSGDSVEQIQEQMEEMNLYDSIGDEEEKQ